MSQSFVELNHAKELRTTKVTNNYYDEIIELSGSELDEFPTPTESRIEDHEGSQHSKSMEGDILHERGDSPPSANLSQTDEDYDEEDDEEDEEEEEAPIVLRPSHTGRPSAAPAGRGGLGIPAPGGLGPDPNDGAGSIGTKPINVLGDDFDDEIDEHDSIAFNNTGGLGGFPASTTSSNNSTGVPVSEELKELFQYIQRYKPQETELETELKAFIPDYVPAIGDIDAFIKIPRPDKIPDLLGLTFLDEPSANQSDPTVLDLRLRAITKSTTASAPVTVRSLEAAALKANPKLIDSWIKNIRDLHAQKPPQTVHYTKKMPEIEDLMQVWPTEFEEALTQVNLPPAELDTPLPQYAQLLSLLLDIPISGPALPSSAKSKNPQQPQKPPGKSLSSGSTHVVEALHIMFTLYSEFSNSAHFKALGRTVGS
ncbi:intraflagellar transport complex B protein 46 C terminal-domain-containing protein [Powellomyces hirtus]|nr:intraflagellar transport complex B protein 46 C terminal-domain-containing protein [Powellomyces hirtus]